MLIGTCFYYAPDGTMLSAMDTDVSAEYAARAADDSSYVEWACSNGDRRDVRWFHRGEQIAEPPFVVLERAKRKADLTAPFSVGGATVRIQPARGERVSVEIDGAVSVYHPRDMVPALDAAPDVRAAWETMRKRALEILALGAEAQS